MNDGPKLTDWFPPHVQPARPGVYEVLPDWWCALSERWFRYWDGAYWHVGAEDPAMAARVRAVCSRQPGCKWRGLAEPLQ